MCKNEKIKDFITTKNESILNIIRKNTNKIFTKQNRNKRPWNKNFNLPEYLIGKPTQYLWAVNINKFVSIHLFIPVFMIIYRLENFKLKCINKK